MSEPLSTHDLSRIDDQVHLAERKGDSLVMLNTRDVRTMLDELEKLRAAQAMREASK